MKSIALVLSLFLSVISFSSCGSPGPANVAACKSFYASLKCGTADLSTSALTCDNYANTTCDISAYFTCLQGHYVCTNGQFDSEKIGTIGECSSQAVCK